MILSEIFNEFIGVVQANDKDKFTIGLLDARGKVISCSDESAIGRDLDIQEPTATDFYYQLSAKNLDFGYLWVYSEDDSLKMVGNLLGESLNIRILYEMNHDLLKAHGTKDDELIKCLLDEDNFDMNRILRLMNELELDENKTRVAIYAYNSKGFDVDEILRLKVNPSNKEIMYSLLDSTNLLIFKDVPDDCTNQKLKTYLKKFVSELQNWGLMDCYYIAGSLQNKLKLYSYSYKNCLWVKKNVPIMKDKLVFFEDNKFEFLLSLVSVNDVRNVFDYYRDTSKAIDIDEFISIVHSLYINDFNITQTAEDLFLHKNSLIYKIKKYEEMFNIDVRGTFQGKMFLYLISKLFKEEKKQRQVGVKS